MQKLLLLTLTLLWTSSVLAEPYNTVLYLNAGNAAPFSGVLLNNDKAKIIYNQLLERDSYMKELSSLSVSVTTLEEINKEEQKKTKILLDQNDLLSIQLKDAQSLSTVKKVMWVGVGAALATTVVMVMNGLKK